VALRDDMRTHLPTLLPKYIALLGEAERSGVYNLVPPTLRTLECLEAALEEHMQLLLPALVHLMDPGKARRRGMCSARHNFSVVNDDSHEDHGDDDVVHDDADADDNDVGGVHACDPVVPAA
jgi:hypothetical protein